MTYEMRKLEATDIFPMCSIISKIGLKNIKPIIEDGTINAIIATAQDDESSTDVEKVGLGLFLELGDVVCGNINNCKKEIFEFLASVAKVPVAELHKAGMDEFAEIIIDFLRKEELKDFLKVVSKFLK